MTTKLGVQKNLVCREAQKRFAALEGRSFDAVTMGVSDKAATEHHLQICLRCALEYRLFKLQSAVLDAAATPEPITPDEQFFRAVRARIARGPEVSQARPADESWAAALLLTARQLFPAMAVLLLLIVGATLLWNQPRPETSQAAVRPRERVVFSDMYDYPAPTRDDVLETLVAVEEK